jgi:hypothetical protein
MIFHSNHHIHHAASLHQTIRIDLTHKHDIQLTRSPLKRQLHAACLSVFSYVDINMPHVFVCAILVCVVCVSFEYVFAHFCVSDVQTCAQSMDRYAHQQEHRADSTEPNSKKDRHDIMIAAT